MRRNRAIIVLTVLLLLPSLWLVATASLGGLRGQILAVGAVFIVTAVIAGLWRGHRRGTLLPNRCGTCGEGMTQMAPGALRPPEGATGPDPRWRCTRCGRLA